MWHPQAGLFVSPNMTYIPEMEESDRPKPDLSKPRILSDDDIYMAFRPRMVYNTGDLFGRLNVNRNSIAGAIVPAAGGGFILGVDLAESWIRLENALLDLGNSLMPSSGYPAISYPKFPYQHGYRRSHRTREIALRCALLSRDAFVELSSLVTFILTLNMDPQRSLEPAFQKLMHRRLEPVHAAWIDLLTVSHVSNFAEHFRVGVVINPYKSHWAPHLPKFAIARIPIWIIWGHHYRSLSPIEPCLNALLPPEDHIQEIIRREKVSSNLILPSYRFDPSQSDAYGADDFMADTFPSHENFCDYSSVPMPASSAPSSSLASTVASPLSSSVVVSTSAPLSSLHRPVSSSNSNEAKARALLALEEYFGKLEKERFARLAIETVIEKERRIAQEKHADTHKHSKTSTVYVWIPVGDGSYRQEKVNSKQVDTEWSNFTRNQRRFTGHRNQWDLCPQLSEYSEENPESAEPDDSDDDFGSDSDEPRIPPLSQQTALDQSTSFAIPDDGYTASTLNDLRSPVHVPNAAAVMSEVDALPVPHTETFNFVSFLMDRFGYDLSSPASWTSDSYSTRDTTSKKSNRDNMAKKANHKNDKPATLTFTRAMLALSFRNAPDQPGVQESVLHLVNALSDTTWTFTHLSPSFDYSSQHPTPLSLVSTSLELRVVTSGKQTVYLVQKPGRIDQLSWMIATSDPSTILLIFRKQWQTVDVIARELVQRGTPFNTVKAVTPFEESTPSRDRTLGT